MNYSHRLAIIQRQGRGASRALTHPREPIPVPGNPSATEAAMMLREVLRRELVGIAANQADASYAPTWDTYAYNSGVPAE